MKLLVLIFILFISESFGCEIRLPESVLWISKWDGEVSSYPFVQQDCQQLQLKLANETIAYAAGEITLQRLNEMNEGIVFVSDNDAVKFSQIESYIKEKFHDAQTAGMITQAPYQKSAIALGKQDTIEISCHPCLFQANEDLRIKISSFGHPIRSIELAANFTKMVDAFQVVRVINAFNGPITHQSIKKVKAPAHQYSHYFTAEEAFKYYHANKTLRVGEYIRTSDVQAITLIRAGDRADVVFQNNQISIRSQAISRQAGGLGDQVEVYNPKNNRKYIGTVTDHQKVVIDI